MRAWCRCRYARGWLAVDVVAALPYQLFSRAMFAAPTHAGAVSDGWFALFRLAGLLRLGHLHRELIGRQKRRALHQILAWLALFFYITHVAACIYWFISVTRLRRAAWSNLHLMVASLRRPAHVVAGTCSVLLGTFLLRIVAGTTSTSRRPTSCASRGRWRTAGCRPRSTRPTCRRCARARHRPASSARIASLHRARMSLQVRARDIDEFLDPKPVMLDREPDILDCYMYAFSWAVLQTSGLGSVLPMTMGRTSWSQSVFTILMAVLAISFQAVVIGEVTSTITRINACAQRGPNPQTPAMRG